MVSRIPRKGKERVRKEGRRKGGRKGETIFG